jgi:hypothetical protein
MIFRNLLVEEPLGDCFLLLFKKYSKEFSEHDNKLNLDNIEWLYSGVITNLIEIPKSDPLNSIILTLVPVDEFNDEEYVDVSIKPQNGKICAMDFLSWSEVIDAKIEVLGCSLDGGQIIAEILWEMTFYGFSESEIGNERNFLLNSMKSIMKEKNGKSD